MQNWIKLGLLYDKQFYNAVPVAHVIKDTLIIYFSSRNDSNYSIPYEVHIELFTWKIIYEGALGIPLGDKGSFDENGVMPTSILAIKGKLYLYYIGWNVGKSVPFRNSIGMAISEDQGKTFHKFSDGPILDRGIFDKCFVASNSVIQDNGILRMYYLSCDEWELVNGGLRHRYNIKYAESSNGIDWNRQGKVAIDYKCESEYAISTPRVIKRKKGYSMWYSYRASELSDSYRIGYAESIDGTEWERLDHLVDLEPSKSGWDSEMVCYPSIFTHNGIHFMLYNGNGYGKSGIGLAILK